MPCSMCRAVVKQGVHSTTENLIGTRSYLVQVVCETLRPPKDVYRILTSRFLFFVIITTPQEHDFAKVPTQCTDESAKSCEKT